MSDIILTKKQTIALDALERPEITEVLFGGGAGGAKSFLGCLWIILNCLQYPDTRWLIGRSKLKALKHYNVNNYVNKLEDILNKRRDTLQNISLI